MDNSQGATVSSGAPAAQNVTKSISTNGQKIGTAQKVKISGKEVTIYQQPDGSYYQYDDNGNITEVGRIGNDGRYYTRPDTNEGTYEWLNGKWLQNDQAFLNWKQQPADKRGTYNYNPNSYQAQHYTKTASGLRINDYGQIDYQNSVNAQEYARRLHDDRWDQYWDKKDQLRELRRNGDISRGQYKAQKDALWGAHKAQKGYDKTFVDNYTTARQAYYNNQVTPTPSSGPTYVQDTSNNSENTPPVPQTITPKETWVRRTGGKLSYLDYLTIND